MEDTNPSYILELPQELIDSWIDYIQLLRQESDSPEEFTFALRSCSLVCKSWLSRCRKHLFGELNLKSTPNFRRRVQLLLQADDSSCLPPLPYVEKLTICEGPFTQTPWLVNDVTFRLLPYARLPFTNLRAVELGSSLARSSYEIDCVSLSAFLETNQTLECLILIGISFNKLNELLELLSSLNQHLHLHTLGLISLLFQNPFGKSEVKDFLDSRPPHDNLRRPRLKTLTFQNPDDRILDALFVQPNAVFDLSELEVLDLSTNMPTEAGAKAFGEEQDHALRIPACCGSLVQLDLDIRDFLWTGVTFSDLTHYLQHLNKLERLALKGLVLSHGWAYQMSFIVTMIPALPYSLRYLTLHADIRFPALFEQFHELDEALSSAPDCMELREIKVILGFRFSNNGEINIEHVNSSFPKCQERGLSIIVEKTTKRSRF